MADDNVIGQVNIQIEADASDLQGQFDAAVSQAQDAGDQIASAFNALVGIGEALAITQGLKDFGEEALNVYSTIESVTVGLTQLTKSAEDADAIITDIKNLASTEPFAFPEIAPTIQKMVALGVSVDQLPEVMQAAADAAAATGNSFQQVANSIDRMGLSGTVSSRALVQLGISTEDLGNAMGVAASEVKAAFLAMDQEERIDAITAALEKFGGAAAAQADTIAGKWQLLQNQFELVMEGIGQALAPAITEILSFGKEALSVAQELIDGFNQLPEPVKLAADTILILAAAVPPLFAAVGLLGQGIIGVNAALVPFNELLVAMGVKSAAAAAGQTVAAEATVATGVASATAATEVGALAVAETGAAEASGIAAIQLGLFGEALEATTVYTTTAIEQMSLFGEETSSIAVGAEAAGSSISLMGVAATTAGAAIAAFVGFEIGKWAADNIPGLASLANTFTDIADHVFPNFKAAVQGTATDFGLVSQQSRDTAASIKTLQAQVASAGYELAQGAMSNEQYADALRQLRAEIADIITPTSQYGASVQGVIDKQSKLNEAVQQARANLLVITQAYEDGAVSSDVLRAAQTDLQKAVDAVNATSTNYKETLGGMTEEYQKNQSQINTYTQTINQLIAVQDRSAQQEAILDSALNTRWALIQKNISANKDLIASIDPAVTAAQALVKSSEDLATKEQAVGIAVGLAKQTLDELTASTDNSASHQRAVNDAITQYANLLKQSGAATTDLISINVNGVQVLTTVADALTKAKSGMDGFTTSMVNGVAVTREIAPATAAAKAQFDQLDTSVGNATALLAPYNAAMQVSIKNASQAAQENSNLVATFTATTQAVADNAQSVQQGAAAFTDLDNASVSVNNIQAQLANGIETTAQAMADLAAQATKAGAAMDNADASMQQFQEGEDSALGSTNSLSYGVAILAGEMSGETTWAGGGAGTAGNVPSPEANNLQYQLQQYQNMVGGGKLVQGQYELPTAAASTTTTTTSLATAVKAVTTATTAQTTATVAQTAAITASTAATTTATTATTALGNATGVLGTNLSNLRQSVADAGNGVNESSVTTTDALGNVSTAYSLTSQAAAQFVDGLGNVYNSYQALVDAIKANPLLAGPATSKSSATSSSSTSGPSPYVLDGVTYATQADMLAAIQANPNLLAHTAQGSQIQTLAPGQTQQSFTINGVGVTQAQYEDSLASSGGTSQLNPYTQLPVSSTGGSFGLPSSVLGNQSGAAITVNMQYPNFQNPQQAQQIMSQIVTMLRNNAGLKI